MQRVVSPRMRRQFSGDDAAALGSMDSHKLLWEQRRRRS